MGREPLTDDEVRRFRNALIVEIHNNLLEYPSGEAKLWLDSLHVKGSVHSGLLAEAAEISDLTGLMFHLPEDATMDLEPETGRIIVNNRIIWGSGAQ